VRIPAEILDRPTSLQYGLVRWSEDSSYPPWSMRAVVLAEASAMIGHVRFHSSPDPGYLRRYASGAVEFGYCIFTDYRRHGYATEAVKAVMEWAQTFFGMRHFIASVSPSNHPSLRLIARLGFVQVGTELDDTDGIEHVFLRVAS
jgi:RimJ/RimL family protein N-acetyltransferase